MILDIILLAVFVFCVILGVRKGLIRSALQFAGTIAAACLSGWLGNMAAHSIYNNFFRPAIIQKVNEQIANTSGTNHGIYNVFSSLPEFMVRALEEIGITQQSLQSEIDAQTGKAAAIVADAFAPILTELLKIMSVIVIFMLLMIIARVAANFVANMFTVPVLREVNAVLGGLFSLLTTLIFVWAVFALLQILLPMTSLEIQDKVQGVLKDSVAAKAIMAFNPLTALFRV